MMESVSLCAQIKSSRPGTGKGNSPVRRGRNVVTSPLFEIALVFVRLDHVAVLIVNPKLPSA